MGLVWFKVFGRDSRCVCTPGWSALGLERRLSEVLGMDCYKCCEELRFWVSVVISEEGRGLVFRFGFAVYKA